jgi:hypothetical protein
VIGDDHRRFWFDETMLAVCLEADGREGQISAPVVATPILEIAARIAVVHRSGMSLPER